MSSSTKLTRDLEQYFFASTSDLHEINDYALWCCWKMGYFQSIYECEPFNQLNEFQQLSFEGLVSMHFEGQKSENSVYSIKKLSQKEIKNKKRIQKRNRKKRLGPLKKTSKSKFASIKKYFKFPSIEQWQSKHRVTITKLRH